MIGQCYGLRVCIFGFQSFQRNVVPSSSRVEHSPFFLPFFLSFSDHCPPTVCDEGYFFQLTTLRHTHSHTHTHTRWDFCGRRIGLSQWPLPDNTNIHKKEIFIHPEGIRTLSPRKSAATDTILRPRGHQDRPVHYAWTDYFHCSLFLYTAPNLLNLVPGKRDSSLFLSFQQYCVHFLTAILPSNIFDSLLYTSITFKIMYSASSRSH